MKSTTQGTGRSMRDLGLRDQIKEVHQVHLQDVELESSLDLHQNLNLDPVFVLHLS